MCSTLEKLVKRNDSLFYILTRLRESYYRVCFNDERMIKHLYKKRFGSYPDLENPSSFAEKIQWLKLYWHDNLASQCADKFLVRKYVEERIGKEYLNNLLGVYDNINEISFNSLPNQFALKGTHGSHFNIICKDKNKINWEKEKSKIKRWSSINYYWQNREWVYKNLQPRFIVEEYLEDGSGSSLTDYKFYCFGGKPHFCQVIKNRGKNETIQFYDLKWNLLPFTGLRRLPFDHSQQEEPLHYQKMIELAQCLASPFPFVRVDFYNIRGQILFGELTFFPQSGLGEFVPHEYDKMVSNLLNIPSIKDK